MLKPNPQAIYPAAVYLLLLLSRPSPSCRPSGSPATAETPQALSVSLQQQQHPTDFHGCPPLQCALDSAAADHGPLLQWTCPCIGVLRWSPVPRPEWRCSNRGTCRHTRPRPAVHALPVPMHVNKGQCMLPGQRCGQEGAVGLHTRDTAAVRPDEGHANCLPVCGVLCHSIVQQAPALRSERG